MGHGIASRRGGVVRMRMMLAMGPVTVDGLLLRSSVFPLDLGGGVGEQVDIKRMGHDRARTAAPMVSMRPQHRAHLAGRGGKGVGR